MSREARKSKRPRLWHFPSGTNRRSGDSFRSHAQHSSSNNGKGDCRLWMKALHSRHPQYIFCKRVKTTIPPCGRDYCKSFHYGIILIVICFGANIGRTTEIVVSCCDLLSKFALALYCDLVLAFVSIGPRKSKIFFEPRSVSGAFYCWFPGKTRGSMYPKSLSRLNFLVEVCGNNWRYRRCATRSAL